MARASHHVSTPASDLRFWACFAVVLALVAQALFPIQAMAMPNADGTGYVYCTGNPDITAAQSQKAPAKGVMGLKCADCVVASITAIETAQPVTLPVRYATAHADLRPAADTSTIKARAPPRPHSCGPPSELHA